MSRIALPEFLTRAELARRWRARVRTIERRIKDGVVRPVRAVAGGRVLIPRVEVLLAEHTMLLGAEDRPQPRTRGG